MKKGGYIIDQVFRGLGAYRATGYAMAALIVERFGESRLQACSHRTADFMQTYQEAAKATENRQPAVINLDLLPTFSEPEFSELVQMLAAAENP